MSSPIRLCRLLGWIRGIDPVDPTRAARFVNQASTTLADLQNLTTPLTRYSLACDSAHDVGEALLAAYGYRTSNGSGQHETLDRFIASVCDALGEVDAAKHFERMRRARNHLHYATAPVGKADADSAIKAAADLLACATGRGPSERPEAMADR